MLVYLFFSLIILGLLFGFRFTELYVDELTDRTDLGLMVSCYLPDLQSSKVDDIVKFYLDVRTASNTTLSDAMGHKPHFRCDYIFSLSPDCCI